MSNTKNTTNHEAKNKEPTIKELKGSTWKDLKKYKWKEVRLSGSTWKDLNSFSWSKALKKLIKVFKRKPDKTINQ